MSLVVTTNGHAAMLHATANGLRLTISEFAVGVGTTLTPSPATLSLSDEIYRAPISVVEAMTPDTMQFTCEIPDTEPNNGSTWTLTEIGLYTDTGILFAVGLIHPYHPKVQGTYYRPIVTLTVANCAEQLDITINTHQSLPYYPVVEAVGSPINTVENTIVIGDGFPNDRYADPEYTSVLAHVTGGAPEIREWAFAGMNRVEHKVKPTEILDRNSTGKTAWDFKLDSNSSWFYPEEVVLVQVVKGAATGQVRKFRYRKTADIFELQGSDAFTTFITDDEINIWRTVPDVFPSQLDSIDGETLQLLDGRPVWGTPGGDLPITNYPRIGRVLPFGFTGDGVTKLFTLPEDACYTLNTISGSVQDVGAYAVVGNQLLFAEAPCVGTHEIMLFLDDLTLNDRQGKEATFYVDHYVVGTSDFNSDNTVLTLDPLKPWPGTAEELMVFHAHTYRAHSEWVYDPVAYTITWSSPLVDGVVDVRWISFNTVIGKIARLHKTGFVSDGSTRIHKLPVAATTEQVFAFSQGGYYDQTIYEVTGDSIELASVPPLGRYVEIFTWENTEPDLTTMIRRDDANVPALNRAQCEVKDGDLRTEGGVPQMFLRGRWRILREDQDPHTTEHIGDSATVDFNCGVVPRFKESVRINIEGRILMTSEYSINGTIVSITIEPKLSVNKKMEITVTDYWIL